MEQIICIVFLISFFIGFSINIIYNNRKEIHTIGKYTSKKLLTDTELKFYTLLKSIANKYNLIIFAQVAVNQIIQPHTRKELYQIGAKSIDFVITDENVNIKFCIELDDYSHKKRSRIKRDNYINQIFKSVNIKLIRIPIDTAFIVERMEKIIKESI